MKPRTLLKFSSYSLMLMLSSMTFAQIDPSIVTGSNMSTDIKNLIGGYGTDMQTPPANPIPGAPASNDTWYLFPKNGTPQIATTQNVATGQGILMPGTSIGPYETKDGAPATQPAITNTLTTSDPVTKSGPLITIANSECPSPSGFGSPVTVGNLKCVPNVMPPHIQNLDMGNFINPLAYNDKGAGAQAFMNYVTGQFIYNPNILYASSPDLKAKLSAGGTYGLALQYIFGARTVAASATVGLANLQHLYQERLPALPTDSSGNPTVNSPIPGVSNPSPLQIDEYSAKRRAINNSSWYTDMETAGPVVIQREMLYILAEMRLEMFKTRMELERLVATTSIAASQQNTIASPAMLAPLYLQLNPQTTNIKGVTPGKPTT